MEKKQPAGCQKSSVCLCKKQVSFLEPRGKERHKQRRLAYLTQQLARDSILSCLHLHLSSVFPNTLISIDESPKKIYTHCVCLQWREAGRKIRVFRSDLLKSWSIGRYTAMHPKNGAWHTEDVSTVSMELSVCLAAPLTFCMIYCKFCKLNNLDFLFCKMNRSILPPRLL